MDMRIDSDFIRIEREKRAWSQEQLAAAAGIGLRTIQRIESTGVASNESAKSLAAVFECSLNELRAVPHTPAHRAFWKRPWLTGIAAAGLVLGVLLVARHAPAKEIMLDVVFNSSSGYGPSTFKMVTTDGKGTEARMEKEAKLVFVPTLEDHDLILISVDIYGYDGVKFTLISHPRVLTRIGKQARIQIGIDGKVFDIKIKPYKI